MAAINIFNESAFELSVNSVSIENSFTQICSDHQLETGWLNVIFLNQKDHTRLNFRHLGHNYPTDVITFPFSESDTVNGEIYINPYMAEANANEYEQSTSMEINRLIIHGILHLVGHNDSTDSERQFMHELENKYLIGFM